LSDRFYVMEHGQVVQGFAAAELDSRMDMLKQYLGV
jgi:branched-chain amino acid transport system ATP-binding protein